MQGYSPERITVRRNTLHSNGLTNLFVDTSANNRIREPFNLQYNAGSITGKHALPKAIIDIYSANKFELPASAYFRIGTTNTDANGNFSYTTNLNIEAIAVTATDFEGNTSNFARLNIVTDVEDEQQIPNVFSLNQNYPNPFNPSTTISFSIPKEEFISLNIYNSLGEEVVEILNETKQAGNYEINFNAAELSSGIYFYKIQAGSFIQTKKMTLLK